MKNMTALMSAFVRWVHYENGFPIIFSDDKAGEILTSEEKKEIAEHLAEGIGFFDPSFEGTARDAVLWIVNHRLLNAVLRGCRQYMIFGAGYDTFSLRNENRGLAVYELDLPEIIADRAERGAAGIPVSCDLSREGWEGSLFASGYDPERRSFSAMLGLTYYLSSGELKAFLKKLSEVTCSGSEVCFDYQTYDEHILTAMNEKLAAGAGA